MQIVAQSSWGQFQQQYQQIQQLANQMQQMQQYEQVQQAPIVRQIGIEQAQPTITERIGGTTVSETTILPPVILPPLPGGIGMGGGAGGSGGQPPPWLTGRGWILPELIISLPEPFTGKRIKALLARKRIKPYGARIGTGVSSLKGIL